MIKIEEVYKLIDIMHTDYSGQCDKKGWDQPEELVNFVKNNQLTDYEYYKAITEYLSGFRDSHVYLNHKIFDKESIGFRVRRFEDDLYITKVDSETRVNLGDRIIAIDDKEIRQIEKSNSLLKKESIQDRQNWGVVLKFSNKIRLLSQDNKEKEIFLKRYPLLATPPEYSFKKISQKIGLITISDFTNENEILKLLQDNSLYSLEKLIIDVRLNSGGSDSTYFPILPIIFNYNDDINKTPHNIDYYYFNYTKRNCTDRIALMNSLLQQNIGEHTKQMINQLKKDCIDNFDVGMTKVFNEKIVIPLNHHNTPKKIIILTDKGCLSSGESFVRIAKNSSKVTIVGRNTAGCLDYSNLNFVAFKNFDLMYGTSRDGLLDVNLGIDGIGEKPHVFIPWNPDMIFKDIDLETAISL